MKQLPVEADVRYRNSAGSKDQCSRSQAHADTNIIHPLVRTHASRVLLQLYQTSFSFAFFFSFTVVIDWMNPKLEQR
jgi:hypothetical protein